jgi:molybdopterin biosynthesis enzyme MoaB
MNEQFKSINYKVILVTDKATYEKDFPSISQLVEWRNEQYDNIGFSYTDSIKWLRQNGVTEEY